MNSNQIPIYSTREFEGMRNAGALAASILDKLQKKIEEPKQKTKLDPSKIKAKSVAPEKKTTSIFSKIKTLASKKPKSKSKSK